MNRRELLWTAAAATVAQAQNPARNITKYVRFEHQKANHYGILRGERISFLSAPYLAGGVETRRATVPLSEVTLLPPVEPPKVLAVGLNYKSHIGNRKPPETPEYFWKPITCLQRPGGPIVIPKDAKNVHYEGELVIVMGKKARHVTREQAQDCIFGVTCGNDVSERDWQNGPQKDLQWWRAKGADTFGPLGPWVVTGLNYANLMLETRLNGQSVQKQSTSDLLFDCLTIVSYASQYATLEPGDIIYTGTPGSTKKMNPGDVVEVEIEGVGVLRNPVVAA
jgi:2-keto-4-pentenoate hydratase/2-oxohepta-3-ene-1,7-dioic acid hydratase in catechol pathway